MFLITPQRQPGTIRDKDHQENSGSHKALRSPPAGLPWWFQPTTRTTEKRSHPPNSVTATVGPCITVKGTPEKASCSEQTLHEPSAQTGRAFPASDGDNIPSDNDMILDGVKDVDGLGVMDTEVYESEKWINAE